MNFLDLLQIEPDNQEFVNSINNGKDIIAHIKNSLNFSLIELNNFINCSKKLRDYGVCNSVISVGDVMYICLNCNQNEDERLRYGQCANCFYNSDHTGH